MMLMVNVSIANGDDEYNFSVQWPNDSGYCGNNCDGKFFGGVEWFQRGNIICYSYVSIGGSGRKVV